ELLESGLALLAAQPRLLDPAERHVESQVEMLVDPDRAGVDRTRDGRRLVEILAPYCAAKPIVAGIGARDHVLDRVVAEQRNERAELLLGHQPRIVGEIAHDR